MGTPAVARVFDGLSRTPGNPWVFPGRKKGARLVNLNDSWDRVRKRTGLEDVRLHDLRHSCASWSTNALFLMALFFSRKIRNHIVT